MYILPPFQVLPCSPAARWVEALASLQGWLSNRSDSFVARSHLHVEPGDIAFDASMKGDITLVESAQTLRVGPVDRRVVSILTRVIPAHAVVLPSALFVTNCQSDAGGKGMCIFRPDLFVRIHAWNSMNRHLHEAGNLDRTVLALFMEGDRHRFHPKYRGDERCKSSYRTTN